MIIRRRGEGGFSLVEVILSAAVFALLIMAIVGAIIYGRESTEVAGSKSRAIAFADEGIEVIRNLRDQSFANLTDGTHGLAISSGEWVLLGASDVNGVFTRQIEIGTINENTKSVTSTVTWQQTPSRTGRVVVSSRITNWRAPKPRGGMLVYGDGGTTQDFIRYKTLDSSGVWSGASLTADVDPATTNRSLRAVQVYSSATRNEKLMISKHLAGTNAQRIYAQVYNGSNWGNVVLLSSWTSNTFINVENFSGAYLQNGDFMVVYSDNTTIPKFRTWNGSVWSGPINTQNIVGIPSFIVAKARPGTNEVMAAFFDQGSDTNTEYFNGGAYVTGNWTWHTEHSAVAPVTTKRLVDFAWSPNNSLVGGLVYSNSGTDLTLNVKIWTANSSGGGSWSATANTSPNQANRLGAVSISGRPGANEFIACDKDANATPRIICYRNNFTPTWSNPANQIISPTPPGTDAGVQKSYDIAFEPQTGSTALGVYSDNTTVPKLKKYNPGSNSWDAAPTNLNTLGGSLETVKLIPHPDTDDILILLANTNQDSYSLIWNGSTDSIYSTPAGKAFTSHNINGSADTDFWIDFAWDRY